MRPSLRQARWILLSVALGGCAALPGPSPVETPGAAEPKTPPVRKLTSFSNAMSCMDDLFLGYGVKTKYIGAISVPDQTGAGIGGGALSMLISAVSEMNRRSNAFQFVYLPVSFAGDVPNAETGRFDFVQLMNHIQIALQGRRELIDMPDYLLIASVSELDQHVIRRGVGGGIDLTEIGIGASGERQVSVMTTDFNVADGKSFKILNGKNATNTVAIINRGAGVDLDARFEGAGGFLTLAINHAEGHHAALRNLIQLSAIETLGKLSQVPYQRCLVQRRAAPRAVTSTGVSAITLTTPRGDNPRYRVGDKIEVNVSPNRTADVFCYYENAKGKIWQVRPNKFQPRTTLGARETARIPGTPRFDLVLDTAPATEKLMCLATPAETAGAIVQRLPNTATRTDLQPLAARSLDEIEEAFLRIVPNDVARTDLEIRVQ